VVFSSGMPLKMVGLDVSRKHAPPSRLRRRQRCGA